MGLPAVILDEKYGFGHIERQMRSESLEETRRATVCSTAYIARIGRGPCDPPGTNHSESQSDRRDEISSAMGRACSWRKKASRKRPRRRSKLPFNVLVMEDD